jgi:tRNA dimethylallyltransferase
MSHPTPGLIVIAGPTGAGKSELALRIAARFKGEILSCDSVQIYRFFNIGTAKLSEEQRRGIPHHLIDVADPPDIFAAGDFARMGRPILRAIADCGNVPVIAGGTGLYVRALIDGLAPAPSRDEALRTRLRSRETATPGSIHRILHRFDPETAAKIHPNDTPKVIRAIEIRLSGGTPVRRTGRDSLRGFRVLKIGLFPNREQLYARLEARVESMFDGGLVEETASILARGYPETCKPFESIGYKQAVQFLKGEISVRDAIFYAKRETRRYAKRQMTWFRQDPGLEVVPGFGDHPDVISEVEERVSLFINP